MLGNIGTAKSSKVEGISGNIYPPLLPRNVNDSHTYEAPTEVPYPLFSQAQKCSVQDFFFHLHFYNESIQCCQHYGQLKDKTCPAACFVTVLPTFNCPNSQKRHESIANMERHQFMVLKTWILPSHIKNP